MGREFQYVRVADDFEKRIKSGVYKAGEKLPSIRGLHKALGLSITTVYQAMMELEKRRLVEPRRRSGFFVLPPVKRTLDPPAPDKGELLPYRISVNEMVAGIVEVMGDESVIQFGGAAPSPELLPTKKIARAFRSALNTDMKGTLTYDQPRGHEGLRREIAKRMVGRAEDVSADRVVITHGCMEAVALCLNAVVKPGEAVAVESPTFHGFLQLIEDMHLSVVEIPVHPKDGIDLDALEKAISSGHVKACLLVPNVNNPVGFVMPDENKRRLVEMTNRLGVPVIEDGIYNDLLFQGDPVTTLTAHDREGLVMHCSSFSKTLAPGLRVGWVMPGRFYTKIKRLKVNSTIMCSGLNQRVAADCLSTGYYDRHLRTMRNRLKSQVLRMSRAIAEYFPEDTAISEPKGGLLLWVRLPECVDSLDVYRRAMKKGVATLPGHLCAGKGRFGNYMRVSCGSPWNDRVEEGVAILGNIVKELC